VEVVYHGDKNDISIRYAIENVEIFHLEQEKIGENWFLGRSGVGCSYYICISNLLL